MADYDCVPDFAGVVLSVRVVSVLYLAPYFYLADFGFRDDYGVWATGGYRDDTDGPVDSNTLVYETEGICADGGLELDAGIRAHVCRSSAEGALCPRPFPGFDDRAGPPDVLRHVHEGRAEQFQVYLSTLLTSFAAILDALVACFAIIMGALEAADEEALEAFNEHVREVLPDAVSSSVGTFGLRYKHVLALESSHPGAFQRLGPFLRRSSGLLWQARCMG